MINPPNLLAIVSVGLSILAFQNPNINKNLILYPYIMKRENQWYRLVTHAFIHGDLMHLLFNMIALWSFGNFVYNSLNMTMPLPESHFYGLYLGAIIFSSISDIIKHHNNPHYASLGASGAVSAVVFLAILFDPWTMILILFIPCPGIIFGVIYLIYCNYMSRKNNDRINHDAHFYGAVFGLIYPLFFAPEIYSKFIDLLLHPHF
ncbi:MAG: rhomboid family intramembrane serine protease [Prevotellaceae bacterium]|jgi:membrane associated rhomboid family serine protease|nr:rhomboid family intramembrane serine protease [Prevotellaceae bacterium]